VFPLAFTLDHVGPMTRSVADNALLLQAMAAHDPHDPGSAAAPARAYAEKLARGVAGLRIGYVRHFHTTDVPANPEVAAALDEAASVFRREGALVHDVTLPPLSEFAAVNRTVLNGEAWAIHADWLRTRPGAYGRLARRRLMAGAFLSAGDYVQAQRRRTELIAAVQTVLRDVDVLLAASSMDPACRIDDAEMVERTYPRQARTPFNVTGHPALAMMSGLSTDGLPLSLQIIGRYFDEATVYQAAAAFERATPWHTMRAGE
jgi:aspartyl-tRNA(Asn)/glutamyl-tRNA(Gln) amidotransferase subunit A